MADNTPNPSLAALRIERGSATAPRKPIHWGRWIMVLLIVLAVAAWLLVPRKPEVQATTVVTTYPSQQYALLTASGYVVAQRRAAVATKATGRLKTLLVREGSVVKQNELIAELDASDVQASLQVAQAGLKQAQALQWQAQVQLNNAEADYKRTQGLQAQGFVSALAVDAAQTRVANARAVLAANTAGLQQAQAQIKVQQVNQDFTQIRAPFDGVVLQKNANVGDIITPFSSAVGSQGAVVTMADMSTLEVEADVSESNLVKIKVGAPVEVTLDALPGARFRGTVSGIVPTVDRAKATVMTKVRFEKLDARILPEMSAKAMFLSQVATDADQQPVLAINPAALYKQGNDDLVWRIKTHESVSMLEAVTVRLGRKLGDLQEVQGGLVSGDKLVLKPDAALQAGKPVNVVVK